MKVCSSLIFLWDLILGPQIIMVVVLRTEISLDLIFYGKKRPQFPARS